MKKYKLITLIDITKSDATRTEGDRIKVGQQANFNSLLQGIGMRSNVDWSADPKVADGRLPNGSGKARHWIWHFYCEREDVFLKDDDPVGLLKDDLNGVPVVAQLNNTADIDPACFLTKGDKVNTWVYEITDIE